MLEILLLENNAREQLLDLVISRTFLEEDIQSVKHKGNIINRNMFNSSANYRTILKSLIENEISIKCATHAD